MDAVARWSATVSTGEAIPTLVLRGAREAFAGRRGPAFLEIPHDFLSAPVRWRAQAPLKERGLPPEPVAVERALRVLQNAKRPVIWAGGGAVSGGAADLLARVADTLDAPAVTTSAAKGLLEPDHPLLVGFRPHQPEVTKLLSSADTILIVGSDLDGMNTQGWRIPLPRPRVSINTVAEDARRNYASDVVVEADARAALEAILPALSARKANGERRVADVRKAADKALRGEKEFAEPYRFMQAISAAVPSDAVVVADMAVAGYWLGAYYVAPQVRAFQSPLGS